MTTEYLIKEDTPIVWADETDYAGGSKVGGTRTHDLDLTDLLFTAARQGVKADLGATRAMRYAITLAVEFKAADTPESGETVNLYWAPSGSVTAGVANQGGCAGTDAAYTGTAGDSLNDSLKQLIFIGAIVLTSDVVAVVQRQTFVFSPPTRYGQPVVLNNTNAEDFNDVDAQEMYVRMVPLINEGQ
jgi:hypothetical protein